MISHFFYCILETVDLGSFLITLLLFIRGIEEEEWLLFVKEEEPNFITDEGFDY
jgi:hypothetical protein